MMINKLLKSRLLLKKLFGFFVKKNKKLISIDVGYRNIKVVEANLFEDNIIHVKKFGIAPTPSTCIKNGKIFDSERLAFVVKKEMTGKKMKARQAKIVMSGTCIISRVFIVDMIKGRDADYAIQQSIKENIPVNTANYKVVYKVLKQFKESKIHKLKVFITAVRKDIINSYVEVLEKCNLKPVAIDIPANSISKFFNREVIADKRQHEFIRRHKEFINSTYAVLDFGSETTIVNILTDNVLEFNRVLLFGSSNFDKEISNKMSKTIEEGEYIKKKIGLIKPPDSANEEDKKAYEINKVLIDKLIKQIAICFFFYEKKLFGLKVKGVYMIGGGSLIHGLRDYLETKLNVPVYPVNQIKLKGLELSKEINKDYICYLINSVGITL